MYGTVATRGGIIYRVLGVLLTEISGSKCSKPRSPEKMVLW